MSSYRGAPFSPVESQVDLMKSHVTRAVPQVLKSEGGRTLRLAVPQGWTEAALCVGQSDRFDESTGVNAGEAAKRCEGCPVIAECLSAAMAEEHGLSAGNRYTIRGGKTPKERAEMETADAACEFGHVGRWSNPKVGKRRCLVCLAAASREMYEAQRTDEGFKERKRARMRRLRATQRVTCLGCRKEMGVDRFPDHLAGHEDGAAA